MTIEELENEITELREKHNKLADTVMGLCEGFETIIIYANTLQERLTKFVTWPKLKL